MSGQGGGRLDWSTNLPQVATQIQQALRQIQASTQAMGQGAGGAQFLQGFEARIAQVAAAMRTQLAAAAQGFEQEMTRAAAAGQRQTGRDARGRTLAQATRPAIDNALAQINQLTSQITHALPAQFAPMRNQLQNQLRTASGMLVESYRDSVRQISSTLGREARALGMTQPGHGPFAVPSQPGGKALDKARTQALLAPAADKVGPRQVRQMQDAMKSLSTAGQNIQDMQRGAVRSVQDMTRQTARRVADDLRQQRLRERDPARHGPSQPGGAGRVQVPGVGPVFFDQKGVPHVRMPKGEDGRSAGVRELDRRELDPTDREALAQRRQAQIDRRWRDLETEARKENVQRQKAYGRALYDETRTMVNQRQGFRVGSGAQAVVAMPGGQMRAFDSKKGQARVLEGEEAVQARERVNKRLAQLHGEAAKENVAQEKRAQERRRRAIVEGERQTFQHLNRELAQQRAFRSGRGAGRYVQTDAGGVFEMDSKNQRARQLQGQEKAAAGVRLQDELNRRNKDLAKSRQEQTRAAQQETRRWLSREEGHQRVQRAGTYARHTPTGRVFAMEGRGETRRAREVRDVAELSDAERKLNEQRAKDARREDSRRSRAQREARDRRGAMPMGAPAGGGGGGMIDKAFRRMSGSDGGRGLRGRDIAGSMMQYGRYFLASGAIIGVISAMRAAKAAAVDYRESLTDLEVALGASGRATAPFIAGLSDIARFAGANTGAAIDSAVRGVRAFTQESAEMSERDGIEFGLGPIRFEGGTSAFQQQAEAIGTQVAETAQQLAVIAEKDLKSATGDVISIGFAFGLDDAGASIEAGFSRITDAIAIAKRQFSGDSAEIAQGLSSFAAVASEAGFTLEESANLISLVQARTDQSGRAVATRLSRITSIIGGSAGRGALERLNTQLQPELQIDTSASVRDQLMQVSNIYSELSQQQQNMIRNAMGGTANVRELIPILQAPEELRRASDAQFDNVGAGMDEFQRKARDLAGTLRRLSGDVQGIVTALFEAGLGDVFLIGLKGIEPLTNALRTLLHVYNRIFDIVNKVDLGFMRMGDSIQTLIMLFAQLKAAQFLFAKAAAAGYVVPHLARTAGTAGAASRFKGVQGTMRTDVHRPTMQGTGEMVAMMAAMFGLGGGRFGLGRTGMNRQQRAWNRQRGDMPRQTHADPFDQLQQDFGDKVSFANAQLGLLAMATLNMGESVSAAWSKMRGFINANPLLVLAAGVVAIARAWDSAKEALAGIEQGQEAYRQTAPESSAMELRDFAQLQKSAAEETRQAVSGIFGWMTDAMVGFRGRQTAGQLDVRAQLVHDFAKDFEEEQKKFARSQTDASDMIRADTAEGAGESLEILASEGRDAITQADALSAAIRRMADDAERASRQLNELEIFQLGFDMVDAMRGEVKTEADLALDRTSRTTSQGWSWGRAGAKEIRETRRDAKELQDIVNDQDAMETIDQAVRDYVQASGGDTSDAAKERLKEFMVEQYKRELDKRGIELSDAGEEALENAAAHAANNVLKSWEEVEDPMAAMAVAQLSIQKQREKRDQVASRMRMGVDSDRGMGADIAATEQHLEGLKADREALQRQAAEHGFDPGPQLEQIDQEILEVELEQIDNRRKRIQSLLTLTQSELSSGDELGRLDAQLKAVRDERRVTPIGDTEARDELKAQENDLRQQIARASQTRDAAEARAGIDSRDELGRADADVEAAQAMVDLIKSLEGEGAKSAEYWDAVDALNETKLDRARKEVELSGAQDIAALDVRDSIGRAEQAVQQATKELELEIEGTKGYADKQEEYNQKVHELNRLRIDTAAAWRLAGVDPRDTLGRINAELSNAIAEYNDAFQGSAEQGQAWDRIRSLEQQRIDERRAISQAERRAAIDPRDQRALIVAEWKSAAEDYQASLAGTQERASAREAMRKAQLDIAQHDRDYAAAVLLASVDPDSQTEKARADLQIAAANLRGQIRGTLAWQEAYNEWRQTQVALADAALHEQSLMRQLSIDLTDPVATAEEALQTARARLRQARNRGAPPDVLAEREIDVRNAEAQAEAAAFRQRMQDAQTANELGRMSHAAYMSYLNEEAARLRSIANRTRQQQEQLDEVERALKAGAEEMHGQFNIGDIKMPTPYEVRRAIAAKAAGLDPAAVAEGSARMVGGFQMPVAQHQAASTQQHNTILVNGADTAEVTRILKQILGPQAIQRNSSGSARRI